MAKEFVCKCGKNEKNVAFNENIFIKLQKNVEYPIIVDNGDALGVLGAVKITASNEPLIIFALSYEEIFKNIDNYRLERVKIDDDDYLFQLIAKG